MWYYLDFPKEVYEKNAIVAIGFYKAKEEKIIVISRMKYFDSVWWLATIKNPHYNKKNRNLEGKDLEVIKIKSLLVAVELGWKIKKIL